MSHNLFDGLAGVSLDGDSSGLGTSEVRFEDPVPTITGIITLDEEDVFQCGRCRKQFTSLPMFMNHKQQHTASTVDTGGGEPFDTLSQLEHSDLVSEAEAVGQSIILSDEILFSMDQQVGEPQASNPTKLYPRFLHAGKFMSFIE
ncbi:hypothetical protein B566_EDAN005968 [Ephemera danica]|nr:hypothetical protein B566_EDAN005968 [Ephemera danica]